MAMNVIRPNRVSKMAMWYLLVMCERLLVGCLGSPKSGMEPVWVSGARIGSVLVAFWDFLARIEELQNQSLAILDGTRARQNVQALILEGFWEQNGDQKVCQGKETLVLRVG